MYLSVAPLATDWNTLHEAPLLSTLLPKTSLPSPPAAAQRDDRDQEESAERRPNGNKDRLMLIKPVGETAAAVGRPDVRWSGRGESVQERLVLSRVDTL